MKKILLTLLKGLWIGGTLTVPGVSGGSMAMILNIYDKLLWAVNSLIKKGGEKKKAFMFLLWTALGGGVGFVLFSKIVGALLERCPLYVCFFFVGAVIGGVPMVIKKAEAKKIEALDVVAVLLGAAAVWLISLIPSGIFSIDGVGGVGGFSLKLLCGVLLAVGLVLPGISLSQMLYVFGIYGEVVDRVSRLDILPLVPFGIGGIVGIFATSMCVEALLKKHPRRVYLVIFGFLVGSAPTMFKGQSFAGVPAWGYPIFAVLAAAGFAAVFFMSVAESKK
jgi:putative membrane protein